MRLRALVRLVGLVAGLLALVLAPAPRPVRAAADFTPTNNLLTARTDHTATLLRNDKVLIVGGIDGTGTIVSTAELYDPATGQFSPTLGAPKVARWRHGAALLPNGDVLIAGGSTGIDSSGTLPLERYNAETGTFSIIPNSVAAARHFASVTTLRDERVLIAGGLSNASFPSAVQLFDPGTNAVTTIEDGLKEARYHHVAVRLNDDTVLFVGGRNRSGWLASAEIFNPVNATFSVLGAALGTPRWDIAAALLPNGQVLLAGGANGLGDVAVADLYDPISKSFIPLGPMPTTRSRGSAAARQCSATDRY